VYGVESSQALPHHVRVKGYVAGGTEHVEIETRFQPGRAGGRREGGRRNSHGTGIWKCIGIYREGDRKMDMDRYGVIIQSIARSFIT